MAKAVEKSWNPNFYNVSTEERNLIEKRAELRKQLKAEWMKKSTDPRRVGAINDPALARNYALKFTRVKEMKITKMRLVYGAALTLPIVLHSLWLMRCKNQLESKIESGELTSKERSKAFIM